LEEIEGTVSLCCLSRSLGRTGDGFFNSRKIIGRIGWKGELKVPTRVVKVLFLKLRKCDRQRPNGRSGKKALNLLYIMVFQVWHVRLQIT
jgi:hypothetical protein